MADATIKYLRFFSWALVIAVLGFFIVAEIGLTPTQTFETNGQNQTRSFSPFGPPVRMRQSDKMDNMAWAIAEPIYIDARLPILTKEVDLSLWWWKDATLPDPVLGVVAPDDTFTLFPFTEKNVDGEDTVSTVHIPLSRALRRDGSYRFMISLPGVSPEHPLTLRRLKISAKR